MELIKITEFQRRYWGENGTPLCSQTIRNRIRDGEIPGLRVGKLWYVDWHAFRKSSGNELVSMVLRDLA